MMIIIYQDHLFQILHTLTKVESIDKSIDDCQQTLSNVSTMMWPTISRTSVNEFTTKVTEGYISRVFPTLFPISS